MFKAICALGALSLSTALIVPAVAYSQESPSVRVSYADLDLTTEIGQQTLTLRVVRAANQLCGVGKWKALKLAAVARECRRDAVANAQPAYEAAVANAHDNKVAARRSAAAIVMPSVRI